MKLLRNFIPFRVNYNFKLLIDTPNKLEGNGITIITKSLEATKAIINTGLFQPSHVRSYYMDRFLDQNIFRKRIVMDRLGIYKNIKETLPITNFPITLDAAKKRNTFIGCYPSYFYADSIPGIITKTKRQEYFEKIFKADLASLEKFSTKYVIFDMDLLASDYKTKNFNILNGLTTASTVYLYFFEKIHSKTINELKDYRIIFFSASLNAAFYISFEEDKIKTLTTEKFKNLYNSLAKQILGVKLDETEKLETGKPIDAIIETEDTKSQERVNAALDGIRKSLKISDAMPITTEQQEYLNDIAVEVEKILEENEGITNKDFKTKIEESEAVRKLVNNVQNSRTVTVQKFLMNATLKKLEEKQNNATVVIDGVEVKLADKLKVLENTSLQPIEYKADVLHNELKQSSMKAFKESYQKDLYEFDQYRIFNSFSKSDDIPIFLESITRRDTSDAMNRKDTLEIKFMTPNNRPKVMNIDVPKISSDGYLFVNGSRKQITNQITMMPIVKIWSSGEDAVQFATNYNKIFLGRKGGNVSKQTASLLKAVKHFVDNKKLSGKNYLISQGNSTLANEGRFYSLEYESLATKMVSIKLSEMTFCFSQKMMKEILTKRGIDLTAFYTKFVTEVDFYPVGINHEYIYFGHTDGRLFEAKIATKETKEISPSLSEFIYKEFEKVNPEVHENLKSLTYEGSNFIYTKLRAANLEIPLLVFLGYKVGLTNLLEMYDIEYDFVTDGKKSSKFNTAVPFSNGTLLYNDNELKKNLLINGIYQFETKGYAIEDFAANGNAYHDLFYEAGVPRYGKALSNFYSLFIDPITADILRDLGLPTSIEGSFLYCNDLLSTSKYSNKSDMEIFRMRNLEIINDILYRMVSRNIMSFRRSNTGDNVGLAVRSDGLIKELLECPNVDDAPLLNPIREVENLAKCTYKGPGAPAFNHGKGTEDVRYYDPSMQGIFGVTTPADVNAGIVRRLSMNSMIVSKRGYVKTKEPGMKLNATNVLSLGEITGSFNARHADPSREKFTTDHKF